jgi:hypothetical protein
MFSLTHLCVVTTTHRTIPYNPNVLIYKEIHLIISGIVPVPYNMARHSFSSKFYLFDIMNLNFT